MNPRGWQRIVIGSWVVATLGMIAVAVSSRTVGKPPWWLGPSTNPAPVLFALVPILLLTVPMLAATRLGRRAALVGGLCALGLAVVATVDRSATPGVAVVEAAVAAAMAMVSVAHWLALGTV